VAPLSKLFVQKLAGPDTYPSLYSPKLIALNDGKWIKFLYRGNPTIGNLPPSAMLTLGCKWDSLELQKEVNVVSRMFCLTEVTSLAN
jgi:hypothetical protein